MTISFNATLPPTAVSQSTTIIVKTQADVLIVDASITVSKSINSVMTVVGQGITDSSGITMFYLITGDTYRFDVSASGYSSTGIYLTILASSYTVVLNKTISINIHDVFDAMQYTFSPQDTSLTTCESRDFQFYVADITGNTSIDSFSLNVTWNGTQTLYFVSDGTNRVYGALNFTLNLTGYSGTLNVTGSFTRFGYDEVSVHAIYRISSWCGQKYTLQDLLAYIANEDMGVSRAALGVVMLFMISIFVSGVILFGWIGGGLIGLCFLALLPMAGIISWTLYIFIGMVVMAAIFLVSRGI